jgi:phosphodiesterase/alkaline phosphatase D-like protein
VHADLENLEPARTYHYRIIASNNNDKTPQQVIGEPHAFTTIAVPPILTGAEAGQITQSTAVITATLQAQGLPTRWELQLATNPGALEYKAAGNSTSPEAETIGAQLENLQPNTTYYYKLTAENPDGATETSILSFTTTTNPAPQTAQAPSFPILGVPPNVFPAEAKVTSTTPKKTAKCPKGHKRNKGRCVRIKRRGKRAKRGRTH